MALLVASVFYGGDKAANENKNHLWRTLQERFLQRTTSDYSHAVYLNSISNLDDYSHLEIIGSNDMGKSEAPCLNHINGLRKIVEYCREHDEYDRYLILDSDAFPINSKWQKNLDYRLKKDNFNVAAVVRLENFDLFPHPSAMYFNRKGIEEAEFVSIDSLPSEKIFLTSRIFNLNLNFKDPTVDMPFFPLTRTNVWNAHPLIAGLYYDSFFHMSAGSRSPITRTGLWKYHEKYNDDDIVSRRIIHNLANDEEGYIHKLRFGHNEDFAPVKDILI